MGEGKNNMVVADALGAASDRYITAAVEGESLSDLMYEYGNTFENALGHFYSSCEMSQRVRLKQSFPDEFKKFSQLHSFIEEEKLSYTYEFDGDNWKRVEDD